MKHFTALQVSGDARLAGLGIAQGTENLLLAATLLGHPRGLLSAASEPREGQNPNSSLEQFSRVGSPSRYWGTQIRLNLTRGERPVVDPDLIDPAGEILAPDAIPANAQDVG